MKAFILNKLNLSRGSSKDRDSSKEKEQRKEKIPPLGPLPEWPPPQRTDSTPNSINSFKPLPELSSRDLPPIGEPLYDSTEVYEESPTTPTPASTPTPTQTPIPTAVRSEVDKPQSRAAQQSISPRPGPSTSTKVVRKATSESTSAATTATATAIVVDVHKKVAFISPPPTPGTERPLRSPTPTKASATTMKKIPSSQGRTSTSTTTTAVAASSKTDVASIKTAKPSAARSTTSPYPNKGFSDSASVQQSVRSNTPYSQSNSSSRILGPVSWSEVAEVDLVSNLGPRERTRQEVLWEIVTSEERYVAELVKMKETFIDPLLHPYSTVPGSPNSLDYDDYSSRVDTPYESLDRLPIASRFLSPTGFRPDTPTTKAAPSSPRRDDKEDTPNIDTSEDEVDDEMGKGITSTSKKALMNTTMKHNHPRSPYGTTATRTRNGEVPFPSRSHNSLPSPPRANDSTHSLSRQSFIGDSAQSTRAPTSNSRVLRKTHKSNPSDVVINGAIPPRQLPEDLRICLEVVENSLIDGHIRLADGLRKRYEEQYPLVRSLADVFVSNSHILTGYATFVLHLERALEQVDTALSAASNAPKKSKKQDGDQTLKIGTFLQKLEESAVVKGETGLAISLSKPFQRLLKYPLLFQNLLFHTDPSTFEYESTLQMVAEVETIVRSIEDEKIQKEERDKTRDVFGRIEGLDKVKQLVLPKPSRVLVEERMVIHNDLSKSSSPPPVSGNGKVKGKTSFKRLSDVLQSGSNGMGGKKDLWLVVFNDVVLRCQRTGTTSLPIGGASNGRANSLPEFQGKAKYATTGRRNSHAKPRNMYKFIKIETWDIGGVVQPRQGVISMDEVVRSRTLHASVQPRIMPLPDEDEDEDGGESDDSDRKSKMSFSYWGADKITLQKPVTKPRQLSSSQPGARRVPPTGSASYGRESSANAKFGTRLVSGEHQVSVPRPASRRTGAVTPVGRRQPGQSDDHNSVIVKATVTRPAWNESTRATATPIPKRARNTSQTSTAIATRTANNSGSSTTKLASPAPSEDSGVGMYRQIIAQDPSLTRV